MSDTHDHSDPAPDTNPAEAAHETPQDGGPRILPPRASADQSAATPRNPDAVVSVAGNEFTWPVPDRSVDVAGRRLPLELAVVAGVHALAALWLFIALHDLWPIVPDLISGLFSDMFSFAISWIVLIVAALLFYLIALLGYCAFKLVRGDPVGRGLAAVLCGILTLLQFTEARMASVTFIWFVSCVCVAVLFLSPWARRALHLDTATSRPASVVLSQTLAVTYLTLLGVITLALVPGIRFIGDLGAEFVFFELFAGASVGVGLLGVRRLNAGPDKGARIMLTIATVAPVIAMLTSGTGAGVALGLGILVGVVIPLWALPDARAWFGEPPLMMPSQAQPHGE